MPSLKAIRKRIGTVKNTQKITKAMKMVAAAKLRRAQRAIVDARPYAMKLRDVLSSLALRADLASHPLLARNEKPRCAILVVMCSDRGLCGAFNSALLRAAERFIRENNDKYPEGVKVAVCGKKGRDYFRRRSHPIFFEKIDVIGKASIETARSLSDPLVHEFVDFGNGLEEIFVLYNSFKSAISQTPTLAKLLPIEPTPQEANSTAVDFIYEPSQEQLLGHLLPLYVEIEIYRALLESAASEFGSRMSAMDSATRNSKELAKSLTLQFNRARQAAITKELVEIVSGAETLKG
jgi:F-type H+-transporting ATPase subunit gamma